MAQVWELCKTDVDAALEFARKNRIALEFDGLRKIQIPNENPSLKLILHSGVINARSQAGLSLSFD